MKNIGCIVSAVVFIFFHAVSTHASIYFEENPHYQYLGYRQGKNGNEDGKFSSLETRIVLSSLVLPHLLKLSIIGHESQHERSAFANGAESVSIKWESNNSMAAKVKWTGHFTRDEEIKMVTAGLAWNNYQAEKVFQQNLGEVVGGDDLLWYGINQLNMAHYIMTRDDQDPYDDINNWLTLLSDNKPETVALLEKDLRLGAAWQAAGCIVPALSGFRWLLGGKIKIPSFWFNTQTELTDAGVLYALSFWQKMKNGITTKIRPGYGWDRIKNKPIYSLEGEMRGAHVSGVTTNLTGGYSKTKDSSYTVGVSLRKEITRKATVELSSNWYSGYHRLDISSKDSDVEVVGKINCTF